MKRLEPYPIAVSLFFIFTIFYVVCIGIKLILTTAGIAEIWQMHKLWEFLLPGFKGLDSLSILIGLIEVSVGSYTIRYVVVPLYNFFVKDKIGDVKLEVRPILLRFKSLFLSFTIYFLFLYVVCILYDIIIPPEYQMLKIWIVLLPGFSGLTFGNFLLGVLDIIVYSAYTSFIFSKTLNYFEKSRLVNMNLKKGD